MSNPVGAAGEPWQWDEPHWRGLVNQVRAGRRLAPARWKGGAAAKSAEAQELQAGQVRSFRITKLDRAAKKIEVELE